MKATKGNDGYCRHVDALISALQRVVVGGGRENGTELDNYGNVLHVADVLCSVPQSNKVVGGCVTGRAPIVGDAVRQV